MSEYFGQLRQRLSPLVSEEQINHTYQRLHSLAKGNTVSVTDNSYEVHNYSVWIPNKQTDTTIAADEFLTYAESEEEQIDNIKLLCQTTKKRLIVTIRDYNL